MDPQPVLARRLGVVDAVVIGLGSMIGAGVFAVWAPAARAAGSALLVFSLLQARVLRFRLLNLVASCTLTVFNAMLMVWPMVAMNLVIAGINVWFIVRLVRERGDEKVYEVVAVGPDESYLQHFLKVQAADIARYFPRFDASPGTGGLGDGRSVAACRVASR